MTDASPGPNASAARILIVDDDERNLLALSQVCEPVAGVVCVSSGRDALRQLLREDFAVILLDVFMPDLDGYETAALIRERAQSARIPIIFLSAVNKETEHLMRGYAMGAVDYVFKPVDPIVLRSKVSVFVDLFQMRRQLELSERRQASILRALPMAIYEVTEKDGLLLRRFHGGDLTRFLGDEAEAVSRNERAWEDWVHPDDRELLYSEPERGGDTVTVEYRWIGPGGARHHILDQRIATTKATGERRWAGSLLDITERKELEARLVHAGKIDALGQLTGGVAHDFNNLLAAILGGISILERRLELGEKELRVVEQMRHAATQGTELVRRLMAFARQQELSPSNVSPATLCESVAGLVTHTLGGSVTVKWDCPDLGLNLYVDRGQLELAVMNLIINARDAMPGGGEIGVEFARVENTPADKPMLCIRIADSGCGIPASKLAKVTEPFFTTKEMGKGTGLGLSMVSGFVDQSGGELRISSREGEGTTIELILPATESQVSNAPGEGDCSLSWLAGKNLLIIDDDDAVREILSEQFRDSGALIDGFASGLAALEAVRQRPDKYDYVLCDFAMPEMDGLETLQSIGQIAPSARGVLMSGNVTDSRLEKQVEVPVVRKPINLEALEEAFASVA
ncbi:response regulator [Tsuneonella troitsensis]|uniref:response regulator n=1 Tax=Tsuneonella troitsensis TaxID=292222 RepID=UPI000709C84A|nr:response regulator [Tsuneonella troitsensis]